MSPSPYDVNSKLSEFINGPTYGTLNDEQRRVVIQRIKGAQPQQPQPTFKEGVPAGVSMMGPSNQYKGLSDEAIDILRPTVSESIATPVGAMTGPFAPAVRTGVYTGVDALLQYLKKEKPSSVGSALAEGGTQALTNAAITKLISTIGRGVSAVRNADQPEIFNFKPTTGQALEATGSSKLAAVANILEDFSLTAKQKALERTAGAGFVEALKESKKIGFDRTVGGQYMFSMNPQKMLGKVNEFAPGATFEVVDKTIADPKKLQATLSAAQASGVGENLKRSLQGYQFQRMFNEAAARDVEGTVIKIDPKKLVDQWTDPYMQDSLKTLYNAKQRADISQFFKNVEITQQLPHRFPIAKSLMFMHGGIGISMGLLTGNLPLGATSATTAFLGAEAVGRLLTSPKTARLMVALAGGEPLGVSEQYAAKMISNVLQGSVVAAINQDGSRTPMIVGQK